MTRAGTGPGWLTPGLMTENDEGTATPDPHNDLATRLSLGRELQSFGGFGDRTPPVALGDKSARFRIGGMGSKARSVPRARFAYKGSARKS